MIIESTSFNLCMVVSTSKWVSYRFESPSVLSVCFIITPSDQAAQRCWKLFAYILTHVSLSVHGGGNVWNRVAGEVLQLQQAGPLPVGKQLQQHRVRMQTQRHAHTHVGQQGDVCLTEEQMEDFNVYSAKTLKVWFFWPSRWNETSFSIAYFGFYYSLSLFLSFTSVKKIYTTQSRDLQPNAWQSV